MDVPQWKGQRDACGVRGSSRVGQAVKTEREKDIGEAKSVMRRMWEAGVLGERVGLGERGWSGWEPE